MMLIKSVHLEKENKTGKSACFDQLNHPEIYFVKTKRGRKGKYVSHCTYWKNCNILHFVKTKGVRKGIPVSTVYRY